MKVKLPIIGQVSINEKPQVKEVVKEDKGVISSTSELLGGFLDFGMTKLSTEKTISGKLLEANREWVYRNNDVIAKCVSDMDFKLYKVTFSKGEFVYEEIKEHEILDLLDRFNEATSKTDGIYVTQSHKKLAGDAFWYIEKEAGIPSKIYTLEPDKIELDLDDFTKISKNMIKGYTYKDIINGKKVEQKYKVNEIVHFKSPNPSNMFRGIGAVEVAAETIDLDNLSTEVTRKFFENGAIVDFMLTTEKNLTDEQIKRVKRQMRNEHGGWRNAFKLLIMGGGLKPEQLRANNKDMEFLSQLEWYRDKIMVIFGNTKASLGLIDDVNRASHESSIISWKQSTVKPEMQAIANTINEFLVPMFPDSENLIIGFEDPVPENVEAKYAKARIFKETGVTSRNEIREVLDLVALDGEEHEAVPIPSEMPAPLRNVDTDKILRKRGLYNKLDAHVQIYKNARKMARLVIKNKKNSHKTVVKEASKAEQIEISREERFNKFQEKQLRIVDNVEERFYNKVQQFIQDVKEEVLKNYPEDRPKSYNKQLFESEDYETKAMLDFTPLLEEIALITGNDAKDLIDMPTPYDPTDQREMIRERVSKFSKSMLETEQEKMTDIISIGVKNGESPAEIRSKMEASFDELTRTQADRITRTEVLNASNQAAIEAWKQSGVVKGVEWKIASGADKECEQYDGKIKPLGKGFFKETEWTDGNPPIHPNCRCTLVPIYQEDYAGYDFFESFKRFFDLGEEGFVQIAEEPKSAKTTVYRGEGKNLPDSSPDALGDAYYVSRDKKTAETFGEVKQLELPFGDGFILQIQNDEQYQSLINRAIKFAVDNDLDLDSKLAIPRYIRHLGFKAAEINPNLDPLGGIGVVDPKAIASLKKKGITIGDFEKNKLVKELEEQKKYAKELEKIIGVDDE